MFVLGREWSGGYLDYYRAEGQLRISVRAWLTVCPISGMFFVRPRSLRLIWNYLREFGFWTVMRKIMSRLQESLGNEKVLAVGLGRICQTDFGSEWSQGDPVAFVAPCHPKGVERIVLPSDFVRKVNEELLERVELKDGVHWLDEAPETLLDETVMGWSPHSGEPVPQEAVARMLTEGIRFWEDLSLPCGTNLPLAAQTPIVSRSEDALPAQSDLTAVVFGLGNHAKTCLMHEIDRRIRVVCVHELDPTQIGPIDKLSWTADTSPVLRPQERADVYFIAGYHHTHADLAVKALEQGAYAVVEKPLVTTKNQLQNIQAALRKHPGRIFVCFQKRYNPIWKLAIKDLGVKPADPIHYHCIVFEVPLPRRHWYRWPNSCSPLVSNGCHWLDHFLFLNAYQPVKRRNVWRADNGDICVNLDLTNGAHFSMVLTKHGSDRIGMQEHVELRANDITVRVDNSSRYFAEGPDRVLRKTKIGRMVEDRLMYRTITRKIVEGEDGDSLQSVEMSCGLLMELEEQLRS